MRRVNFISWSKRSIRTQVLAIVLLSPLPIVALAAFQVYEVIQAARKNVEQIASSIAQVNSAEIARMLDGSKTFLEEMAKNRVSQAVN